MGEVKVRPPQEVISMKGSLHGWGAVIRQFQTVFTALWVGSLHGYAVHPHAIQWKYRQVKTMRYWQRTKFAQLLWEAPSAAVVVTYSYERSRWMGIMGLVIKVCSVVDTWWRLLNLSISRWDVYICGVNLSRCLLDSYWSLPTCGGVYKIWN